MNHEKIIKRKDGSRVKISVHFYMWGSTTFGYDTSVQICGKGKRKWQMFVDADDYKYRAMPMEDREVFKNQQELLAVTKEDILEAKTELWNKLKPNI